MVKSLFLTILGVGAVQINSALDAIFARVASLEGPAYLWYAIRLEQLPLALFGIALSSALLPPLSRAAQAGDLEKHRELLSYGFGRSFALMMSCTVALLVLGCAGVNLLYGRGDFSQEATMQTVHCLWGYSLGLVPSVFVLLLAPSFYAKKDYKTPVFASLLSVAVNIVLNALFVSVFKWGAFSIAVATSVSSFCNMAFLVYRHQSIFKIGRWCSFGKIGGGICVAGLLTWLVGYFLHDQTWAVMLGKEVIFNRELGHQVLHCGLLSGVYGCTLWMIMKKMGVTDLLHD
jgi:putative peptidoglycan lipid II flippase